MRTKSMHDVTLQLEGELSQLARHADTARLTASAMRAQLGVLKQIRSPESLAGTPVAPLHAALGLGGIGLAGHSSNLGDDPVIRRLVHDSPQQVKNTCSYHYMHSKSAMLLIRLMKTPGHSNATRC